MAADIDSTRWEVWEITPDGDEYEWYAEADQVGEAAHLASLLEHDEWVLVEVTRKVALRPTNGPGLYLPDVSGVVSDDQ